MWKKISVGALVLASVAAAYYLGAPEERPAGEHGADSASAERAPGSRIVARYRIERSFTLSASPAEVLGHLADLRRWGAWSPWERVDPKLRRVFSGVPGSAGQSYYWADDSGMSRGRMTVLAVHEDRVTLEREVVTPHSYETDLEITVAAAGAGARVTWVMSGEDEANADAPRGVSEVLAADADRALARLKSVVEAQVRGDTFHVERSIGIAAAPRFVAAYVADVRRWASWSPWERSGGRVTRSRAGKPLRPGSTYYWTGDIDRGRVTVLDASAERVQMELLVEQPQPYSADLDFLVQADGGGSRVTWVMSGENDGVRAALYPSGDADRELGRILEGGLSTLKARVEAITLAARGTLHADAR